MTDDDLRWRLELLKVELEAGKIHVAEHLADNLRKSLAAIRCGTDGAVDLTTVDSRIRALSLVVAHVHNRNDLKAAASLRDIQEMYFRYVDDSFGHMYKQMKADGLDANKYSYLMSRSQVAIDEIVPQIPDFINGLVEFWDSVGEGLFYHLQDLSATKGVFGGDLFPSYTKNIASTCGLYLDTIILNDPFLHSKKLFELWSPSEQLRYLIKHAMGVLSYKDLALANLGTPIVVVVPNRSSIDTDEQDFLLRVSETDALKHAKALFDLTFTSEKELLEYGRQLDTPEKVLRAVKDRSRLLFDTEWMESLDQQIARAARDQAEVIGMEHPGITVVGQCLGRMRQATDILLKSRYLGGTPLIDAPTSWRYFGWKLEYNAALSPDAVHPLHMVRGLQQAGVIEMEWLGDIPPEALIEMRREGALDEIRAALAVGVDSLAKANPTNFFRTGDQVIENLHEAFAKHSENVRQLRKKGFRFLGYDLGSWFVTGAVEIAAIATGTPTFGAAAFAVNEVVDAPKLKEIPSKFRALRNAHTELKKSPMGLLFKHRPKG